MRKKNKTNKSIGRWKNIRKKLYYWLIDYRSSIFYGIILIVLWTYIIINWKICISMQFFSQFDGNNILFLVGIAMLILPFCDIEAKDFKLHKRVNRDMKNDLQDKTMKFLQEQKELEERVVFEGGDEDDGQ